ncbi:MAG: site-specific integrase [Paludibacter sp.]|nr:site-specific integrase [Paludibacter sp.]
MANVSAFIKPTKKDSKTKVRFYVTRGRTEKRLFYTSDIEVNPEHFDSKSGTIKSRISFYTDTERAEFNSLVSEAKKTILRAYNNAENKQELTSELLAIEIDKIMHPEKHIEIEAINQVPEYLIAYIEDFIKKAPTRKKKRQNTFIREGTIKSYVSNLARLKAFTKFKKKSDFLLSEVDTKFVNDYVDFLTKTKRTVRTKKGEVVNEVKQYTNNTIGNAMKLLKTFLMDAPGHNVNLEDDIVVYKEEVDSVYLNETELQILKDFDFSDVPHLDRVRDGFLCLAWTCSRISDIGKVNNIRNGMIQYNQQKTNNKVVIPLHPVVSEILNKYDGGLPTISDQKFNDYLKDVCRLAGLTELHTITRTVGGKEVTESSPKYELISSHTGRRSFCTNMYKRGLDSLMIRSISGHKTEKSFLTYIKIGAEEHAEMMAKKWSEIYK